ncbi:MAG TPA: hypothetical protein DEP67_06885 [Lachnospiraceae bacterium]|nr:hypothetical protein [Lachnospiraceae bacterium]
MSALFRGLDRCGIVNRFAVKGIGAFLYYEEFMGRRSSGRRIRKLYITAGGFFGRKTACESGQKRGRYL